MATPDASPMLLVNSSQHQGTDNGSTMEDIQETPSTHPSVAPPVASPIQSPATPDAGAMVQSNQNVESSSVSMPSMSDPASTSASASAQGMLPAEATSTHQIEQVQQQAQAKVELLRDDPSTGTAPHTANDTVPAQSQGSTTPAGPRHSAIPQPTEAVPVQMANNDQGSAARIYINTKVTPVLLDGMKWVARNEPEKPLKWLSDYLAKRSADIEGT